MINQESLVRVSSEIAKCKAELIVVTKNRIHEDIITIYNAGFKKFGENRVQELIRKKSDLPKDIEWHMIGHLQRNKVKFIAPFVAMIQSIDSLRLLKEVNKQAKKYDRLIPCLLQVHIAKEETKFGFNKSEIYELLSNNSLTEFQNVQIQGLMAMATFTNDQTQIHQEFVYLNKLLINIRKDFLQDKAYFKELSMGMTSDYKTALACGSTMVRIGSLFFNGKESSK